MISSTVYAATDQRGQAQVALKVFAPSVMGRVAALSEYQSQARQASGLGVEGIARAYDFGIDANAGVPFSTAERIGWAVARSPRARRTARWASPS